MNMINYREWFRVDYVHGRHLSIHTFKYNRPYHIFVQIYSVSNIENLTSTNFYKKVYESIPNNHMHTEFLIRYNNNAFVMKTHLEKDEEYLVKINDIQKKIRMEKIKHLSI